MEHKQHQSSHHKKKSHYYYFIASAVIFIAIAGLYVWRKYKSPMICREVCFSSGNDQNCSTVCINKNEIKG